MILNGRRVRFGHVQRKNYYYNLWLRNACGRF